MQEDAHPLDPVVIDAIREKLVRLDSDLAIRQQEVERSYAAYQNAQAARDHVAASREKLAAYLAEHAGSAPDSVLGGATVTIRAWADGGTAGKRLAPRSLKHEVIAKAKAVLMEAGRMRADEIYEYLVFSGVPLSAENGTRRVTQILSESGLFEPDRVRGWGLKEPATKSDTVAPQDDATPQPRLEIKQ